MQIKMYFTHWSSALHDLKLQDREIKCAFCNKFTTTIKRFMGVTSPQLGQATFFRRNSVISFTEYEYFEMSLHEPNCIQLIKRRYRRCAIRKLISHQWVSSCRRNLYSFHKYLLSLQFRPWAQWSPFETGISDNY